MVKSFEENKQLSAGVSWILLLAYVAAIIGWGLAYFYLIPDRPREHDFGALPDTPGQSVYSTQSTPHPQTPPPQIPALPEANPAKQVGDQP